MIIARGHARKPRRIRTIYNLSRATMLPLPPVPVTLWR